MKNKIDKNVVVAYIDLILRTTSCFEKISRAFDGADTYIDPDSASLFDWFGFPKDTTCEFDMGEDGYYCRDFLLYEFDDARENNMSAIDFYNRLEGLAQND